MKGSVKSTYYTAVLSEDPFNPGLVKVQYRGSKFYLPNPFFYCSYCGTSKFRCKHDEDIK
jgi:hypothetical protein